MLQNSLYVILFFLVVNPTLGLLRLKALNFILEHRLFFGKNTGIVLMYVLNPTSFTRQILSDQSLQCPSEIVSFPVNNNKLTDKLSFEGVLPIVIWLIDFVYVTIVNLIFGSLKLAFGTLYLSRSGRRYGLKKI